MTAALHPHLARAAPALLLGAALVSGILVGQRTGVVASFGFLAAVALAAVAARRRGPLLTLQVLLVICAFQNLIAAPLSYGLSSGAVVALLGAKELFAVVAAIVGFVLLRERFTPLRADRACALFAVVVLGEVLVGGLDRSLAAAASVRQALTLPLLFAVGRSLALAEDEARRAVRFVIALGLVMASFGLLERFVLGDPFWSAWGIGELYRKKGLGAHLFREVPLNFSSWDLGKIVRRLVGTLGEPTSFAHFLAIPVALLVGARSVVPRWGRAAWAIAAPQLAALLLTIGKSGTGCALAGITMGVFVRGKIQRIAMTALGLLAGLGIAVAYAASASLRGNAWVHLKGFAHLADEGVSLFGDGFGSAGNFILAANEHLRGDPTVVGESFAAVLTAQGGLVALVAYLIFCGAVAAALFASRTGGAPLDVRAVLGGLVLGTCLTSFASETPPGFLAGGMTFLLAGVLAAPPRDAG